MNKNLRWKLIAIIAVIVICAWAIYPPSKTVRLGLDLKGGVHLVLQVQTDDALRLETETEMARLREDVPGTTAEELSPTRPCHTESTPAAITSPTVLSTT